MNLYEGFSMFLWLWSLNKELDIKIFLLFSLEYQYYGKLHPKPKLGSMFCVLKIINAYKKKKKKKK